MEDAPPGVFPTLHVPNAGRFPGTADLTLTAIDTSALTVNGGPPPTGVTFDTWTQTSGPTLAVLHVDSLAVASGTVFVAGTRPLVVIASGPITVNGLLDGSALRDMPRAGGGAAGEGSGAGQPGGHAATFVESGASGGGFATVGGMGGIGGAGCSVSAPAVVGGAAYGDPQLTNLVAGSGGGRAYVTSCDSSTGGAGGGAIQLSSATSITIAGSINVGGGGGGGGLTCTAADRNFSGGSGGGSGGAIVLQAPVITSSGALAANGGGGGSSAGDVDGDNVAPFANGQPGFGGQPDANAPAGGLDVGTWSSAGGAGGATTTAPGAGANDTTCLGNAGGGGGSVGRIVIAMPQGASASIGGVVSPPAVTITY